MQGILVNVSYVGEAKEVVIIDVKGFIDTTTSPEVARIISEQIAVRKYCIVINLEGVDYISSAGWGVFVGDLKEIRQNNGDLVLVNMTSNVNNIFELMEFSSILKSFLGVEKAINYFLKVEAEAKKVWNYNQQAAVVNENPELRTVTPTAMEQVKVPIRKPVQGFIKEQAQGTVQGFAKEKKVVHISSYIKEAEKERDNALGYTHTETGKMILKVIMERPYLDVKEIAEALRLPRFGNLRVKKGTVKNELKYMDLLDKAKRFEFVMKSK